VYKGARVQGAVANSFVGSLHNLLICSPCFIGSGIGVGDPLSM
jgi:hypothetical protein